MTQEETDQMEALDAEVSRLTFKVSHLEQSLSYAEHDKEYYRGECTRLRKLLYAVPVKPDELPF